MVWVAWFAGSSVALTACVVLYSYISGVLSDARLLRRSEEWITSLGGSAASGGGESLANSRWYARRILVILNPRSGTGRAKFMYTSLVQPILQRYKCSVTLFETQHANHAYEYASNTHNDLDDQQFELCICISGDGLLSEVVNGLVKRWMPSHVHPGSPGNEFHDELSKVLHRLPLAILPGGTSNGLATSLFGPGLDAVDMLKRIMHSSNPKDCDIISVETPVALTASDAASLPAYSIAAAQHGKQQYKVDMLTMLYGVIADNDALAERALRNWPFLLRTTLAPMIAILMNKRYAAVARFRPARATEEEKTKFHITDEARFPLVVDSTTGKEWRSISGDFLSFVVLNVAWPASDVNMAPGAKVDDGALYICIIRKDIPIWTKLYMFAFLLNDGSINGNPNCEFLKVEEYQLHPHSKDGNLVISGEALTVQSVHGKVQHNAAYFVH